MVLNLYTQIRLLRDQYSGSLFFCINNLAADAAFYTDRGLMAECSCLICIPVSINKYTFDLAGSKSFFPDIRIIFHKPLSQIRFPVFFF